MKKILLLISVLIISVFESYAQEKSTALSIALEMDSICQVNGVKHCVVRFYSLGESNVLRENDHYSGEFQIKDCFLIIDKLRYFNLEKTINFYVDLNYQPIFSKKKKTLIVYLSI